jgi:hypothetical protein
MQLDDRYSRHCLNSRSLFVEDLFHPYISLKGYFFGSHPADPGRVGFWEERLRQTAFEAQWRSF